MGAHEEDRQTHGFINKPPLCHKTLYDWALTRQLFVQPALHMNATSFFGGGASITQLSYVGIARFFRRDIEFNSGNMLQSLMPVRFLLHPFSQPHFCLQKCGQIKSTECHSAAQVLADGCMPSAVYGAEHLARLLVRLPDVMPLSALTDDQLSTVATMLQVRQQIT